MLSLKSGKELISYTLVNILLEPSQWSKANKEINIRIKKCKGLFIHKQHGCVENPKESQENNEY